MRKIDEMYEFQRLEHRAANKRENWLRKRGWKATSSTPGCYWMWEREWEGQTLLVGTEDAARIQEYWDREEDARLHPEEYDD